MTSGFSRTAVDTPNSTDRCMSVLHLMLEVSEEEFPFKSLGVAWSSRHDISICSFFRPKTEVPRSITLYEGDGSVRGFIRALRAAQEAKEYDVLHAHSPHVGFLLLLNQLLHGRSLRGAILRVNYSYSGSGLKLRNRLMLLPIFATFARLTFVSDASFQSFPWPYRLLAGGRSCVIPNGVDVSLLDGVTRGSPPRGSGENFTVACVGRLISSKNPFVVLDAFLRGTDLPSRLSFVGEGYLSNRLVERASEARPDARVEFTGLLPRDDVYRALAGADLFVSASLAEGMPMAVLEAMACRCPVVLSDIPSHREILGDADFIPLVRPNDVAGFASQIKRFQAMSPLERARIGDRCRALVEQRFSLATTHERYEAIYRQVSNLG